jgi:hypothetical protein
MNAPKNHDFRALETRLKSRFNRVFLPISMIRFAT